MNGAEEARNRELTVVVSEPGLLRRLEALILFGCLGFGAWYWFGPGGLAFIALLIEARRSRLFGPARDSFVRIDLDNPGRARIEPWRVCWYPSGGERGLLPPVPVIVFVDEVSAADWSRLRRQLAIGCSTSR